MGHLCFHKDSSGSIIAQTLDRNGSLLWYKIIEKNNSLFDSYKGYGSYAFFRGNKHFGIIYNEIRGVKSEGSFVYVFDDAGNANKEEFQTLKVYNNLLLEVSNINQINSNTIIIPGTTLSYKMLTKVVIPSWD